MNRLYVAVHYKNASLGVPIWAFEEKSIDFFNDPTRVLRCTMSFAVVELKKYLERTLEGLLRKEGYFKFSA